VDLVISDLFMPDMDGIQLIHAAKERYPALPVIVFTAQGSIESAVSAIKEGAFDYLEKPLNPLTFDVVLHRALKFIRLSGENEMLREHYREQFSFHSIVTQSPTMRKVLELAALVASSPKTTISLTGESGVGKEVLARAVHFESGCLPGNFVAVNCAAIPEALLESELFGHVRGAFTGAERDREGKFSQAREDVASGRDRRHAVVAPGQIVAGTGGKDLRKSRIQYAIARRFPGYRRHPSQSYGSG